MQWKHIFCSVLSPILFFFSCPSRCVFFSVFPPCAGPCDSFSTGILKGPNSLPSPSAIRSFPELRLPLLDRPSDCQQQWKENSTEGRNEAHVESPQPQCLCVPGWSSLSSPGGCRGEVGWACTGAGVGGSAAWCPGGGKHTTRMRWSDKMGGLLLLWWPALLSLSSRKKVEGEKPVLALTPPPAPPHSQPSSPIPHSLSFAPELRILTSHMLFIQHLQDDDTSMWLVEGFPGWPLTMSTSGW